MSVITSIYFSFVVLAIIAAGFLMMFAPEKAWPLLKNIGISVVVFIIGTTLFCAAYSALTAVVASVISAVVWIGALALIAIAFIYFFDPQYAINLFQKYRGVVVALIAIPLVILCAVGLVRLLQPLIALLTVSVTAFLIYESRRPRHDSPRKTKHAERTPVLPRTGDEDEPIF